MEQAKRFGVGAVILGLSGLLFGSMAILDSAESTGVFGFAGIAVGVMLLVIGVGKYRGWESFSTNQ
ncbi:hypothetical protein [Natronorubrum sediminis]|uniref:hypothetical protein n=1 Tax=Natronorubrum sediminis TaxID=640943 RepID=UPI0011154308|nr:hypothetical protein [Natronorubrum sediminis]